MFLATLLLVCALSTNSLSEGQQRQGGYYKTISVNNGAQWGDWHHLDMCGEGMYATGFRVRAEPCQGPFCEYDDTALNGVKIHCIHATSHHPTWNAESHAGFWGSWSDARWCPGRLVAFQLNVEGYHSKDNTAVNDINFRCSNGEVRYGSSGLSWGKWGSWSDECQSGGICGIQTKVEAKQGGGDDTALNDVRFVCCH